VLLENYFLCCILDLSEIKCDFTEIPGNFSEGRRPYPARVWVQQGLPHLSGLEAFT